MFWITLSAKSDNFKVILEINLKLEEIRIKNDFGFAVGHARITNSKTKTIAIMIIGEREVGMRLSIWFKTGTSWANKDKGAKKIMVVKKDFIPTPNS